jgi:hypothetical protein
MATAEQTSEADVHKVTQCCTTVVTMMREHTGDAAVQMQGFVALEEASDAGPTARAAAVAVDAVEAVVAALERHHADAYVQFLGGQVLAKLVANSPDACQRAGAAGAVEAVLAAMKAHPASSLVPAQACFTLANLLKGCSTNRLKALDAGAVLAVTAVMHAGRLLENDEAGCVALGQLVEGLRPNTEDLPRFVRLAQQKLSWLRCWRTVICYGYKNPLAKPWRALH